MGMEKAVQLNVHANVPNDLKTRKHLANLHSKEESKTSFHPKTLPSTLKVGKVTKTRMNI